MCAPGATRAHETKREKNGNDGTPTEISGRSMRELDRSRIELSNDDDLYEGDDVESRKNQ